jgi:hypothetical protein
MRRVCSTAIVASAAVFGFAAPAFATAELELTCDGLTAHLTAPSTGGVSHLEGQLDDRVVIDELVPIAAGTKKTVSFPWPNAIRDGRRHKIEGEHDWVNRSGGDEEEEAYVRCNQPPPPPPAPPAPVTTTTTIVNNVTTAVTITLPAAACPVACPGLPPGANPPRPAAPPKKVTRGKRCKKIRVIRYRKVWIHGKDCFGNPTKWYTYKKIKRKRRICL